MVCFGGSLNAIPWCYSAEILPLHVRAQGISIAVMVNWICVSANGTLHGYIMIISR